MYFIAPKAYTLFNPEVEGQIGGVEVDLYFIAAELGKDPSYDLTLITANH